MRLLRKYSKHLAVFMLFVFGSTVVPEKTFAITGGPTMPEYSSFEPASTTNMVNTFTGGFTYNIPLLQIPNGAPISLSYHSGDVSPEALSSWVGLGWTLNPGAINRVKSGYPDEYNNEEVTYYNRMEANWTVSGGTDLGMELFGDELYGLFSSEASIGAGIRFNNYTGFGYNTQLGADFANTLNLTAYNNNGSFGFSYDVNPLGLLCQLTNLAEMESLKQTDFHKIHTFKEDYRVKMTSSLSGANAAKIPSVMPDYWGISGTAKFNFGVNFTPLPIDGELGVNVKFSRQKNIEKKLVKACGFEYNENAATDASVKMDYSVENESTLQPHDIYMGYPVQNKDAYIVSGEGIGGSFQAYRSESACYHPNSYRSESYSVELGGDGNVPSGPITPPPIVLNLEGSGGFEAGAGISSFGIHKWDISDELNFNDDSYFEESNEKVFYRMAGDQSGYVDMEGYDENYYYPENNFSSNNDHFHNNDWRSDDLNKKRSSYIGESSFKDYSKTIDVNGEDYRYDVKERNLHIVTSTGTAVAYKYNDTYPEDAKGEFYIANANGASYVYGLPVFSRNQVDMSYSIKRNATDEYILEPGEGKKLVYPTNTEMDEKAKRKIGVESKTPYTNAHLLSQILSPDYIDRTGNGPTPDDFGSYTRYNYKVAFGGQDDEVPWYSSRTPFDGLFYSEGSLSTNRDNMGSVSYVQKEVYYLHSIASKTHVAVFTTSDREDGLSSGDIYDSSSDELDHQDLITNTTPSSGDKLQKLDRIDLYKISDCIAIEDGIYEPEANAVPIQTVHFDYSYDLCEGIPNNLNTTEPGKLTLEKVWFEYGGIKKAMISPYEFHYEYPESAEIAGYSDLPSQYQSIISEYSTTYEENPGYSPVLSDRWGSYRNFTSMLQPDKLDELANFWPYTYQYDEDDLNFDPAAWCLKQIDLPGSSSILVQYEQNDYQFVQDQPACVMVPLKGSVREDHIDDRYYLDLDKIGIDFSALSGDEREALVEQLFYYQSKKKERLYFSFLYALKGNLPDVDLGNSEYIQGFARVKGYGYDSGGVFFYFKDDGTNATYETTVAYDDDNSNFEYPKRVCTEFYKTQRRGLIDAQNDFGDMGDDGNALEQLANSILPMIQGIDSLAATSDYFDPGMSYVRVQMPYSKSKKGGGVRVKRLLHYDTGITTDSDTEMAMLYGKEYDYKTSFTDAYGNDYSISSGVATNEPDLGIKENPYYKAYSKDGGHSFGEPIVTGMNKYGMEGIVGKSFFPAPSIGYSDVRIKSINSGHSTSGLEERQYYTARDYPIEISASPVNRSEPVGDESISVLGYGVSFTIKRAIQGYLVKRNSMHGTLKSVSKYKNESDPQANYSEVYDYYIPTENVTLMNNKGQLKTVPVKKLGGLKEFYGEAKVVDEYAVNASIERDVTTGTFTFVLPPFIPVPVTLIGSFATTKPKSASIYGSQSKTFVSTKIIDEPVLQKSVTINDNGIIVKSTNEIFDANTVQPVVSSYNDEFNGYYVQQAFRAAWKYKNMQQKFVNQDLEVLFDEGASFANGILSVPEESIGHFTIGDYLLLTDNSDNIYLGHVSDIDYSDYELTIEKSQYSPEFPSIISIEEVKILESGYKNQLTANTGSILYHDATGVPGIFIQADLVSNNLMNQIPASVGESQQVELTGQFELNLSQYADLIACEEVDPYNVPVSKVILKITRVSDTDVRFELLGIEFSCGTETLTLMCTSYSQQLQNF